MTIKNLALFFSLLCLPSASYAFPAPEAMGAISFAVSSVWAHLSAIFGTLLGVSSHSQTSKDSLGKALLFLSALLALSIAINLTQSFLYANNQAVLNEVNFQKVQPVPYPEVERRFHPQESRYTIAPWTYTKDLDVYQLVPVVTEREHQQGTLQSFDADSPVVVLNEHGHVVHRSGIADTQIPVLVDWNDDLSRIALNDLLSSDPSAEFRWLKGGYDALIEHLSSLGDAEHQVVSSEDLRSFQESTEALYIDVSERHAYQERGYYYSAINLPYSAFFSSDVSVSDLDHHEGPVVFFDFYQAKSKAVAHWYYLKTGRKAYILDGGYKELTDRELDWVPFYPNRYRLLSPSQIYDWYVGTQDVVFLDGRSQDQYDASEESWLTISTPVEYTDLEDLYAKVDGLDKSKRYVGFVYDQGNAFKMLVLGHALHERGYTWLGLYTRPQTLSYAEIDDFSKNRPHRITWWQHYVSATEAYPKALSRLYEAMTVPAWVFLLLYGFVFRFALTPITLWTSQPFFVQRPLSPSVRAISTVGFIVILILFAMMLQKWIHDFGDLHWSYLPLTQDELTDQSAWITLVATGLIAVQLLVTPGLRLFSSLGRMVFAAMSVLVVGYFLNGLTTGLLLYVSGITLASIVLGAGELLIRRKRSPTHSDDLPMFDKGGRGYPLPCIAEVTEQSHGIKAGRLGEAYRMGFPVPEFFVLDDSLMSFLGVYDNQVRLYQAAKRIGPKVIVRSAALTEDASASRIGRLMSRSVVVDEMTVYGFTAFVSSVMDSQSELAPEHRQVIIQRHVDCRQYAVGVSRDIGDVEFSRIEYGSHQSVTEGAFVEAQRLCDDNLDQGRFSKLHRALRFLEAEYGQAIDAECAFNGNATWLLQVRPYHPFYFCEPKKTEEIANRHTGIDQTTSLTQVDEAGERPSPLSISILQALYGDAVITVNGVPHLVDRTAKPKVFTFNQFVDTLKCTAEEVRKQYETACLLFTRDLSDDVLVAHYAGHIDLLRTTLDLSVQLRVSNRLRRKLNDFSCDGLGYWSEDQAGLLRAYHHPSVFLSTSDFEIRREPIFFDRGFRKDIPSLSRRMDKATRVMTDVHYLTARMYTALSILIHEIDHRVQRNHQGSPGAVYGARNDELMRKQWDTPSLWQSRASALEALQNKATDDVVPRYGSYLEEPLETRIFILNPDDDVSDIPDGAFVIMEQGRSDIIHKMENIDGILCRAGGENSHWMMVARSLNVYAASGDRSLNIEEWQHGCPVSILTF